jgi:Tfp pilus assembly protein FimV
MTLIAAYNVQQLERKELIDGAVPRTNIRVQQLEEQLEKLRESIMENLRNIKASQQALLASLQRKNQRPAIADTVAAGKAAKPG